MPKQLPALHRRPNDTVPLNRSSGGSCCFQEGLLAPFLSVFVITVSPESNGTISSQYLTRSLCNRMRRRGQGLVVNCSLSRVVNCCSLALWYFLALDALTHTSDAERPN